MESRRNPKELSREEMRSVVGGGMSSSAIVNPMAVIGLRAKLAACFGPRVPLVGIDPQPRP